MTLAEIVSEVKKINNKSGTLNWGVCTREDSAVLCCGYLHSRYEPPAPIVCFIIESTEKVDCFKVTAENWEEFLKEWTVTQLSSEEVSAETMTMYVMSKLKEVYACEPVRSSM